MLKFKICLAILLSCSFNANANRGADCAALYNSFYFAKKRDLNIDDLAQKRDEWIKTHLDIHYKDGSSRSERALELKTAIVKKLKLEPALYSDDLFMPRAIYELSRYWYFEGVDVDAKEVFTNMTRGNIKFLFQDIEERGMSTAFYVVTSQNHELIDAMYEPLGESVFSLESLSPLYPELTGSDLRNLYYCLY